MLDFPYRLLFADRNALIVYWNDENTLQNLKLWFTFHCLYVLEILKNFPDITYATVYFGPFFAELFVLTVINVDKSIISVAT